MELRVTCFPNIAQERFIHMMKSFLYIFLVAFVGLILLIGACAEQVPGCTDPSSPNFNPLANRDDGSCQFSVPETYTFSRSDRNTVSYSQSFARQLRIARLAQLLSYFGEQSGLYSDPSPIVFGYPDTLDLQALDQTNTFLAVVPSSLGNLASGDVLSSQFRDHAPLPDLQSLFEEAFTYIEAQANAGNIGSPAVYTSPEGLDYAHLLPPLLAGASLYRPSVDSLLLAIDTLDNINVSGSSTTAERSWDMAFGSLGLPIQGASWYDGTLPYTDLNLNDTLELDSEYVFSYAALALDRQQSHPDIAFADRLFEYFLQGRAALAFGPERIQDASLAAIQIRETWEWLVAATVIHHVNRSIDYLETSPLDSVAYRATWSSAFGHAYTLGMRSDGTMSAAMVADWLNDLGPAPNYASTYPDELRTLRNSLGNLFGFSSSQIESW